MSGGAVDAACRLVRERMFEHVAAHHDLDPIRLAVDGNDIVDTVSGWRLSVAEATAGVEFDETVEYRHPPTEELDENGQGNCHTAFAFVAHRAVVDVDPELGLVKVVQIATAQDVGRALNPLSVLGQIEGGIAQGLGLAVMEEIIQIDGGDPQRQLHRLPAPDVSRHARGRRHPDRGARSPRPARRQGCRRTTVHLLDTGDRECDP